MNSTLTSTIAEHFKRLHGLNNYFELKPKNMTKRKYEKTYGHKVKGESIFSEIPLNQFTFLLHPK